ncbi:hypothetical protein TNCT_654161 [Trichonephila clavata]|uniref:Uncharacterized protein n=1 Tax=Trichonephila clavata TaxID=2740835 RepID=A0A8X6F7U5_TRICU|nr:hypothetical protein TNCT_654161 [Trichonephila clavata]
MGRANCVVSTKMGGGHIQGSEVHRTHRPKDSHVAREVRSPEEFRPDDCSTCEEGTLMEKRLGGLHGHLTKGLVPGLLYRRRTGVMFVS